jgi:hypothetical protein
MRRIAISCSALVAAVAAMLVPSGAAAYERQWHLGADLGYALQGDSSGLHNGLGGGVHLAYGLNDSFNAMVDVDATYHPKNKVVLGSATVGAGYVFDVLQWVPYIGLMVGGYDVFDTSGACGGATQPRCAATHFGAAIPLGVDYQLSRSVAIGGQAKYNFLFLGGAETPVQYLTIFARVEYIWGY